jgi:hypothetical protein
MIPGVGPDLKLYPSGRAGPLPGKAATTKLNDLSQPLIESFNFLLDDGLQLAVADLPRRTIAVSTGESMELWLENVSIGKPTKPSGTDPRLFPSECRELGLTYAAPLTATVCRSMEGTAETVRIPVRLGDVPIMVRSSRCHLAGLSPAELVGVREEAVEFGGYFLCNGIERILRMLQIPKRNYPMAITRSAYTNRGPLYSDKGIVIRCARPDQSSVTLALHYLTDGSCTVRFAVNKQEFFLPVVLVLYACADTSDRDIYERVLAGETGNTYLSDRVLMLLRDAKKLGPALASRAAARAYLGARFRAVLDVKPSISDAEAGQELLDRYVLVHLEPRAAGGPEKAALLLLMLRKLYGFVAGRVGEDNADALCNQELLLGGTLLLTMLKEKLYEYTLGVAGAIKKEDDAYVRSVRLRGEAREREREREAEEMAGGAGAAASRSGDDLLSVAAGSTATGRTGVTGRTTASGSTRSREARAAQPVALADVTFLRRILDRQPEPGRRVTYLISTGNLISSSGLDQMQITGYTVVADKINFLRFTTHFRSVHRGQFFTTMKTTTVRRLLPENWGFLCPVHTPDGGPCGLLNHLAAPCTVTAHPMNEEDYSAVAKRASKGGKVPSSVKDALTTLCVSLGMTPHAALGSVMPANELPILLDGRVLGSAPPHTAHAISRALRRGKALTVGVRAGLDRVGTGTVPGQEEDVARLVRAAVLGRTASRVGSAVAAAVDEEGEPSPPAVGLLSSLPGLCGSIPVPPSMEVAFLPPSWWEAEVDGAITDGAVAAARTARVALFEARAKEAAAKEEQSDEDEGGKDRAGPADDDAAPPTRVLGVFPGLFLSTAPSRPVRPVLQLDTGCVELLSPLEQPFMDIAVWPRDMAEVVQTAGSKGKGKGGGMPSGTYTHIELSPMAMLSEVAAMTPFSDMNQSPRNMYQVRTPRPHPAHPRPSHPPLPPPSVPNGEADNGHAAALVQRAHGHEALPHPHTPGGDRAEQGAGGTGHGRVPQRRERVRRRHCLHGLRHGGRVHHQQGRV